MGSDSDKPSFFRLGQLAVVLAWIVAFWFLLQHLGGPPLLGKFLRPDYWWLVEVGAAILVCFVIALAYCDPHNHGRRGLGLFLQMGIMIVPLLYLPIATVSHLSPEAASKRSLFAPYSGPRKAAAMTPAGRNANLSENPSLMGLIVDAEAYAGKKVTTMGMAYRDDKLPENSFFCYQLLMFCCAADARPIGVLVEYDKSNTVEKGTWVKVEGTVGFTTFKGRPLPKINAEKVIPTAAPKDPYLSP